VGAQEGHGKCCLKSSWEQNGGMRHERTDGGSFYAFKRAVRHFSMGKWGLVNFCNSKRWTKQAAEGAQFTVGNGY
jgi:hypothetical protein